MTLPPTTSNPNPPPPPDADPIVTTLGNRPPTRRNPDRMPDDVVERIAELLHAQRNATMTPQDAQVVLDARDEIVRLRHWYGELMAEIDRLRQWKAGALDVLARWHAVWETAGQPGTLGESAADATAQHIAQQAAYVTDLEQHVTDLEQSLDQVAAAERDRWKAATSAYHYAQPAPTIRDNGPTAQPRYTIEYPDPPAPFYPVACELLDQWVANLNELHQLRDAVYANGLAYDDHDHPDPPCWYCDHHRSERRHAADCPWLAEHNRRLGVTPQ